MFLIRFIFILSFLASSLFSQKTCSFTLARLHYGGGGDWYANPSSLPNLATAVRKETSITLCDTIATIKLVDNNLFHYPFIYMTGHGNVKFSHLERLRLRKFLEHGGFLWADDNFGMDKSFRREMAVLFPENRLTEIPANHPLFTSHYKLSVLPKIHEHDGHPAQAFAIFFDGRIVVLYTFSSDIGDGMEDLHIHNDGETLHKQALKMGVNIVSWFCSAPAEKGSKR